MSYPSGEATGGWPLAVQAPGYDGPEGLEDDSPHVDKRGLGGGYDRGH